MTIELDSWSGYPHEQQFLKDFIEQHAIKNTVFVSGDSHCSWFFDIYGNKTNKIIAHEIGVHAISSGNWGREQPDKSTLWNTVLEQNNPQLRYVDLAGNGFVDLWISKRLIKSTWNYIDVSSNLAVVHKKIQQEIYSL